MMQTRGVAGFHNGEPMLIYQNRNAEPEKLGIKILSELRQCNLANKMHYLEAELWHLKGLDENVLVESTSLERTFRRHLAEDIVRSEAKTVYDIFEPLQGTLMPYLKLLIRHYPDGSDFVDDSYFCKWGYVLNFDTGQFEVLRGDQLKAPSEPLYDRYRQGKDQPAINAYDNMNEVYYPCKIILSYDATKLPSDKQFLHDLRID